MSVKTLSTALNPGYSGPKVPWGRQVVIFEFGLGTDGLPGEVGVGHRTLAFPIPFSGRFRRWTINGVAAPVGDDGVVDIFMNDVSIFSTTPSAKVFYADGESDALVIGTAFNLPRAIKDQLMYAEILQVGSTTPGTGWAVTLEWGDD